MSSILHDIRVAADVAAEALSACGYQADFSPRSLFDVDHFLDENVEHGHPVVGGLMEEDTDARIFSLGAYVGEVLVRCLNASWEVDDDAPENEVTAQVVLANGTRCFPIMRVLKRFERGESESVAALGKALGLDYSGD